MWISLGQYWSVNFETMQIRYQAYDKTEDELTDVPLSLEEVSGTLDWSVEFGSFSDGQQQILTKAYLSWLTETNLLTAKH